MKLVYRSGLSKRQTQLVYSYILMWVLPKLEKEENVVKGNSVQKCVANQLVGRLFVILYFCKTLKKFPHLKFLFLQIYYKYLGS